MRISRTAVCISLLALLVSSPTAFSAVNVGVKCAKAGSTSVQGSSKLVCTKVGSSLIWKASVQTKPATLTPTPAPKTSSAPKPNSMFPVAPTSFADLYEHRDGIAYGAWSKVAETLKSPVRELPVISVYKGPNTSVYVKDQRIPMQFVTRLLPTYEMPKKIVVVYWTNQDISWATDKATELMGAAELQRILQETGGPFADCYTPVNCNVGHAHVAPDGTVYIGIGNPDNAGGDPNFTMGQKEEIEFYHSLQLYQYYLHGTSVSSKGTIMSENYPPAWINIPAENFAYDALRFENNYASFATNQNFSPWMHQLGHPITQEWLDNFLDIKNMYNAWNDDGYATGNDNNCIGASIMEIFVALKGPSILLDFHEQMSRGVAFPDVFKKEFGMSWQEAEPILSKVIYDKYLNNY